MHHKITAHPVGSVVYSVPLVALASTRHGRSGRGKAMGFAGALRRVWIPLIVLAVTSATGLTVSPVRAEFGSVAHACANTAVSDTTLESETRGL
jgi:hypothetical protein